MKTSGISCRERIYQRQLAEEGTGIIKATFLLVLFVFSSTSLHFQKGERQWLLLSEFVALFHSHLCPVLDVKKSITEHPEVGLVWVAMGSGTLRRVRSLAAICHSGDVGMVMCGTYS